MQTRSDLFMRLMAIESASARLEGAFGSDSGLAMMWRSQAALTEACRSVALEDIHVFEGDVVARSMENRLTDMEGARGAQAVHAMLRVMTAPGNLTDDTEAVLARCWRAGLISEDVFVPSFGDIAQDIREDLSTAPTPFLGALKVTSKFRLATQSQSPSAERLVFMVAEHSLRRSGEGEASARRSGSAVDLVRNIRADWCLMPSTALTQNGFRAWSPSSQIGTDNLLAGLQAELGRAIGLLPVLRRWRESALRACDGRGGRSRLLDFIAFLEGNPIVTPSTIAAGIGVTERTGLNLVKQAEEEGILRCITGRRSWRVWATPQMADRIRIRSGLRRPAPGDLQTVRPEEEPAMRSSGSAPAARQGASLEAEAALAELDAAIASVDAVLDRYRNS